MVEISIPTLILQGINFLILVWLLKKFLYKPVLDFLDKRSSEIKSNYQKSEKKKKEARELVRKQKEKLAESKREALEIVERAKKTGSNEKERIISEAKQRAESIIDNTKTQIKAEVQRERENLMEEVGGISVNLAEKIIKRELHLEDIDKMAEDFIKQIKE